MTTQLVEYMEQEVPEGGVGLLRFDVVDGTGAQVPLASLLTLTVTLYDESVGSAIAGPYINSRNAQNILNANGCVVAETTDAATGLPVTRAVLTLGGADNPIVTAGNLTEWHRAFIAWTWVGGGPGRKEIAFKVRDFARV